MNTTLKETKYIPQRQSSQQKRQHPIYDLQEQSFQNDILSVEKLKLQEQLDYYQQKIKDLQTEILQHISRRDQDVISLKMQLQQMENINSELMQRLQAQKRSDEYLTNANQHVATLQKKLDTMQHENNSLQTNINNLTSQNYQLSQKWQKCSQQLKYITNNKGRVKEMEDQLYKKNDELIQLKEKYVASTLELNVCKQSEQEFKNNVQQKIKMLIEQLRDSEAQKQLFQSILAREQKPQATKEDYTSCQQCQELMEENEQLHQQIETFELVQLNNHPNQPLKREISLLQQRCTLLKEQNQNLQKQVEEFNQSLMNEENMVSSLKSTFSLKDNSISKTAEYINCFRAIELFVQDPMTQNKLKQAFEELSIKIEQTYSNPQINYMYDRLLVKYYSLMKNQNSQNFDSTQHKRISQATPKKSEEDYANQSFDFGTDYEKINQTTGKKPFSQKF